MSTTQISTGNRTLISGSNESGDALQEAYVDEGRLYTDSLVSVNAGLYGLVNAQKLYSTSIEVNLASAGTNNPAILFNNPNGSGKTVYLWRVLAGVTIQNVSGEFRIWINPTVTSNGSALTIVNRDVGAGGPASVVTAYSLPTVSANGTLAEGVFQGQNSNSIILTQDFSMALAPNNSLLITGVPLSNNRAAVFTLIWYEE